ncbi:MAG: hypothetical protein GY909_15385 [Oligoflexia bacterium]|nr:hypothetical protein [Oligoflexia bacterium]
MNKSRYWATFMLIAWSLLILGFVLGLTKVIYPSSYEVENYFRPFESFFNNYRYLPRFVAWILLPIFIKTTFWILSSVFSFISNFHHELDYRPFNDFISDSYFKFISSLENIVKSIYEFFTDNDLFVGVVGFFYFLMLFVFMGVLDKDYVSFGVQNVEAYYSAVTFGFFICMGVIPLVLSIIISMIYLFANTALDESFSFYIIDKIDSIPWHISHLEDKLPLYSVREEESNLSVSRDLMVLGSGAMRYIETTRQLFYKFEILTVMRRLFLTSLSLIFLALLKIIQLILYPVTEAHYCIFLNIVSFMSIKVFGIGFYILSAICIGLILLFLTVMSIPPLIYNALAIYIIFILNSEFFNIIKTEGSNLSSTHLGQWMGYNFVFYLSIFVLLIPLGTYFKKGYFPAVFKIFKFTQEKDLYNVSSNYKVSPIIPGVVFFIAFSLISLTELSRNLDYNTLSSSIKRTHYEFVAKIYQKKDKASAKRSIASEKGK